MGVTIVQNKAQLKQLVGGSDSIAMLKDPAPQIFYYVQNAPSLTPDDEAILQVRNTTDRWVTTSANALGATLKGDLQFQGTWNANTNTPDLQTIGAGYDEADEANYYVVSNDGATDLDGETDWKAGDWAIYSGGQWRKIDNTGDAGGAGLAVPANTLVVDPDATPVVGEVYNTADAALAYLKGLVDTVDADRPQATNRWVVESYHPNDSLSEELPLYTELRSMIDKATLGGTINVYTGAAFTGFRDLAILRGFFITGAINVSGANKHLALSACETTGNITFNSANGVLAMLDDTRIGSTLSVLAAFIVAVQPGVVLENTTWTCDVDNLTFSLVGVFFGPSVSLETGLVSGGPLYFLSGCTGGVSHDGGTREIEVHGHSGSVTSTVGVNDFGDYIDNNGLSHVTADDTVNAIKQLDAVIPAPTAAVVSPSGDATGATDRANIETAYAANAVVILAPGVFNIDREIRMNAAQKEIRGSGIEATFVQEGSAYTQTGNEVGAFTMSATSNILSKLTLLSGATLQNVVYVTTGAFGCKIRDLKNTNSNGIVAFFRAKNALASEIIDCDVENCEAVGGGNAAIAHFGSYEGFSSEVKNIFRRIVIRDCRVRGGSTLITYANTTDHETYSDCALRDNDIESTGANAALVAQCGDWLVTGNRTRSTSTTRAMNINNCRSAIITGNKLRFTGGAVTAVLVASSGVGNSNRINFTGNFIVSDTMGATGFAYGANNNGLYKGNTLKGVATESTGTGTGNVFDNKVIA